MNRDGVPAAPHSQPNPTPSPCCAFSGQEVAERGMGLELQFQALSLPQVNKEKIMSDLNAHFDRMVLIIGRSVKNTDEFKK